MSNGKYTVIFNEQGDLRKLFKVYFGTDGTYYVSLPYHRPVGKVLLWKATVNYALAEQEIALETALDLATVAEDRRPKLAHHPDGFIQFSGEGITSGRQASGAPKGMGVKSWPLNNPAPGPAFAVSIWGLDSFDLVTENPPDAFICDRSELIRRTDDCNGLAFEAYYFTPAYRRFVRASPDGSASILLSHPSGSVIKMRVLDSGPKCRWPGFLGLDFYDIPTTFEGAPSGFLLGSSTGNMRSNDKGELLGDAICCQYRRNFSPRPAHLITLLQP